MKTILYTASSRGHKSHGWLDTYHTFSFAGYYDSSRMHFGALRVINDDILQRGKGFETHPHDNMEIISIPLSGELKHADSTGHENIISPGDVQVMSAGSGLTHSEFNASRDKTVNFLQIWIFPKEQNVNPRYDQKNFNYENNTFTGIVFPDYENQYLWIHQDAWLSIGIFDEGKGQEYKVKKDGNGVFAMVIEGEFRVAGQWLNRRDGYGVWETGSIEITALKDSSKILLIDVPMEIG